MQKRKAKQSKKQNNDAWLYGVTGLVVGALLMGTINFMLAVANREDEPRTYNASTTKASHMTMDDMVAVLHGKTGDEFDQTFLQTMIPHHQGAVDMAELMAKQAKHSKLKKLGKSIAAEQTKEIQLMQQWQKDWGYADQASQHMMHMHQQ